MGQTAQISHQSVVYNSFNQNKFQKMSRQNLFSYKGQKGSNYSNLSQQLQQKKICRGNQNIKIMSVLDDSKQVSKQNEKLKNYPKLGFQKEQAKNISQNQNFENKFESLSHNIYNDYKENLVNDTQNKFKNLENKTQQQQNFQTLQTIQDVNNKRQQVNNLSELAFKGGLSSMFNIFRSMNKPFIKTEKEQQNELVFEDIDLLGQDFDVKIAQKPEKKQNDSSTYFDDEMMEDKDKIKQQFKSSSSFEIMKFLLNKQVVQVLGEQAISIYKDINRNLDQKEIGKNFDFDLYLKSEYEFLRNISKVDYQDFLQRGNQSDMTNIVDLKLHQKAQNAIKQKLEQSKLIINFYRSLNWNNVINLQNEYDLIQQKIEQFEKPEEFIFQNDNQNNDLSFQQKFELLEIIENEIQEKNLQNLKAFVFELEQAQRKENLYKKKVTNYAQLILRPPRNTYKDLGTYTETHNNKEYLIESFQIINDKEEYLQCTFVQPKNEADRTGDLMPCVIYSHGNDGNKLQGLEYWKQLADCGINLCTFDFSGCGNSEGDLVTLGHKEQYDLYSVVEYIKENYRVSEIGLWGRSMGAVTSLLYLSNELGEANCIVLDSAFSSLEKVINSLLDQKGIKKQYSQIIIPLVQNAIQEQANMKISDLNIEESAKSCDVPALFIHGNEDEFIDYQHSINNFNAYKGQNKQIQRFTGDHNSTRPNDVVIQIVQFLKKNL